MYKYLLIILLLFHCSQVRGINRDVSGSRIYKNKWKAVVSNIQNLDSLLCEYIEGHGEIELFKKTFEILSEEQKNRINLAIRYNKAKVNFLQQDSKETQIKHPKRLSFYIYDKYYDRLGVDDLALELTVTTSFIDGNIYLYLLKRKGSGYYISYLLGSKKL